MFFLNFLFKNKKKTGEEIIFIEKSKEKKINSFSEDFKNTTEIIKKIDSFFKENELKGFDFYKDFEYFFINIFKMYIMDKNINYNFINVIEEHLLKKDEFIGRNVQISDLDILGNRILIIRFNEFYYEEYLKEMNNWKNIDT